MQRHILALKKQVKSREVIFPDPSFEEEETKDLDEAEVDWNWNDESCAYELALANA
ncbi:hypothetical protein IMZ48_38940 [Candidatus Bathyarchaeota archaeon]|nr:hypothetical protein [Candidatus Bathyarchaeota archaeon]